ncbi:hypothetical protein WA026_022888 [Henosepilachna vigintioctopunctata]|uniref:Uncharacterized protein n=1 Tax=Henosepilachna vigintioctopunctata TaxID=420089 RepID=A0AAW1UEQ0_9CUCU
MESNYIKVAQRASSDISSHRGITKNAIGNSPRMRYSSVVGSSNAITQGHLSNLSEPTEKVNNNENLLHPPYTGNENENQGKWTTVIHNKRKPKNIPNRKDEIVCKGIQNTFATFKGATRR